MSTMRERTIMNQQRASRERELVTRNVQIPIARGLLEGDLVMPAQASGVVLFAHGSGSSRHSPRNRLVASVLQQAGLGTLLMDLLTQDEEARERAGAMLRFDIDLLATRLMTAAQWLENAAMAQGAPVGYFGASTGAAAALIAATARAGNVAAVVSRGGRPDLAGADVLARVQAPTLLLVGSRDPQVLELNREAYWHLRCERRLEIIPGATHLFEEPGTLERVAEHARDWLTRFLAPEHE
jgi:putative phosphoribosyl transferase